MSMSTSLVNCLILDNSNNSGLPAAITATYRDVLRERDSTELEEDALHLKPEVKEDLIHDGANWGIR